MKRVSVGRLPNGVSWYTQFEPKSYVSGVGVRVGSVYDPPNLSGMSHFAEHVLADYTPEIELLLEEYGCGPDESVNIRTDHYSTFYGHGLVLRREYALELFKVFARTIQDSGRRIDEASFLRERMRVLNEYYLRGKDAFETEIDALVHRYLYAQNPARNRIDCDRDELLAMRPVDMRRFIARHYHAGSVFAILLGVPFRKARRLVEEYFGDLPAATHEYPKITETRPVIPTIKRVEVVRRGVHQYHVAIAFPTWPLGHKDDEAVELLVEILGWRLRHRLSYRFSVEKGETARGAYRVPAFLSRSFAHGLLYTQCAVLGKEFLDESIAAVFEECERLKRERIPDLELNALSNKLYNNYVSAFTDSPELLAEMIIDATCNGDEDMRRLNSYLGRLSRVGRKTLQRVANEYLTTNNCLIVVMRPDESAEPNEKTILLP